MKLVVFMKQVPAVSELPWNPKTGSLRRDRAQGMMNPACRHALEAALRLKEAHGGEITAISMGPPSAEEILRQAMALGADRAVLLSDRRLAGADTPATSYTLSLAVRAMCPGFDLLLLGSHTTDSETGQVGPHPGRGTGPALGHQRGRTGRQRRNPAGQAASATIFWKSWRWTFLPWSP